MQYLAQLSTVNRNHRITHKITVFDIEIRTNGRFPAYLHKLIIVSLNVNSGFPIPCHLVYPNVLSWPLSFAAMSFACKK